LKRRRLRRNQNRRQRSSDDYHYLIGDRDRDLEVWADDQKIRAPKNHRIARAENLK
jgi:hypothetical protein